MGLFDFIRRSSSARRADLRRPLAPSPLSEPALPINVSAVASSPPDASTVDVKTTTITTTTTTTTTASSLDSSNNDESEDPEPEELGSLHHYDVVRELGRGATAVVKLGRRQDTQELVALKVFKTSLLKKMREFKRVGRRMVVSTALDKVQKEIAIMKKLAHPNLLQLLEVMDNDDDTLVLALEYAPLGQIMEWEPELQVYKANLTLVNCTNSPNVGKGEFDEAQLRDCVRQLLLGLEYLHDNNICHRDLKPENILVGANNTYKIADFGVAHLFEDEPPSSSPSPSKRGYVTTTAGTYAFMGPETLKGGEFSAYAADVWALGITLYALVYGTIPYYHADVMELFAMIEGEPLRLDDNQREISSGLRTLLEGMLDKDPTTRWSIQRCKEHSWVVEGLPEEEKAAFLKKSTPVSVSEEDVMNAVTRVTSLRVLVRVHMGASKWVGKARAARQRRQEEEKRKAQEEKDAEERTDNQVELV